MLFLKDNTLSITASWQDITGAIIEPTSAEMIIYNSQRKKLETVLLTKDPVTRTYSALYVFNTEGDYYVEAKGMVFGQPVLNREKISVRFTTD